jgi:transcription elongation factor Elf1
MGRRKVQRNKIRRPKRAAALEKRFNCPMCNHENVVQCTIKRAMMKGFASCSVCDANFVCDANKLTTSIDVYSAWVDACHKDS